jgi:hypothetical protein
MHVAVCKRFQTQPNYILSSDTCILKFQHRGLTFLKDDISV